MFINVVFDSVVANVSSQMEATSSVQLKVGIVGVSSIDDETYAIELPSYENNTPNKTLSDRSSNISLVQFICLKITDLFIDAI